MIALLFVGYWRLSWSVPANSDSASAVLQAQDLLHGNWLLGGWAVSDVSFYTTELPQYAVLGAVFGFGTGLVHIAAAMTYTLIVVLVALVAKGRSRGREGLVRALIGGGIVAAPQTSGALVMLLGPDHTGTVVPVLAAYLLIDRARSRWWIPPLAGLILACGMTADPVVALTGCAPLAIASVLRALRPRLTSRWYELSVGFAAAVGGVAGWYAPAAVQALGGFHIYHPNNRTVPLSYLFRHGLWNTTQAVLELFGANPFSSTTFGTSHGLELVLIWVHLAGVLLAVAGLVLALRWFFSPDGLLVAALAVAILLQLAAFLHSIHSTNLESIREIVAVMPLGAVLAARGVAPWLDRRLAQWQAQWQAQRPAVGHKVLPLGLVLGLVAAGYAAGFAYDAVQAAVPSENQGLTAFLEAHHLSDGLAGYWEAGSVTMNSGGRVLVSGVAGTSRRVSPYLWETQNSQYDPAEHDATFVVTGGPRTDVPVRGLEQDALATFGRPARVYRLGTFTILVYSTNLLRDFR